MRSILPDVFGLRSVDRVLPVVPMFHVNAWGSPYAAPMVGASLIMPGRYLDGASMQSLMNSERGHDVRRECRRSGWACCSTSAPPTASSTP